MSNCTIVTDDSGFAVKSNIAPDWALALMSNNVVRISSVLICWRFRVDLVLVGFDGGSGSGSSNVLSSVSSLIARVVFMPADDVPSLNMELLLPRIACVAIVTVAASLEHSNSSMYNFRIGIAFIFRARVVFLVGLDYCK